VSKGTLFGIDQLVLGATTSCDLLDLDGEVVVPIGTQLTPRLLQQIKSSGVIGLISRRSDYACHHMTVQSPGIEVIASRISEMQKRSGISGSLNGTTSRFAINVLSDSFRLIAQRKLPDIDLLMELVDRILHDTELLDISPLPSPRLQRANFIDRLVDGAIDMAVLMGWHLRKSGCDITMLRAGTLGALIHDAGLVFLPSPLLESNGSLNPHELREVRRHPFLGVRALSPLKDRIPSVAQEVILLHHEHEDGSGYPLRRKSDRIPVHAKLAHILDAYIALVSPRPYRKSVSPNRAIEILLRDSGRAFNKEVLRAFIARTGRYPLGSAVVLSSNEVGVVVGLGKGGPFMPVVDVYFSRLHQFSQTPQRVDLGRDSARYIRQAMG